MFDKNAYNNQLSTTWLGHDLIYADQMDSTNSYLRQADDETVEHGTICLTDHQTQGRGRYEREWVTDPGANLTFTLVFRPSGPEGLHVLTLTCALAVTEVLDKWLEANSKIKWPNDIVCQDRKLGGILTESVFSGNSLDRVLVGIGLNVNQESFPGELEGLAASMRIMSNGDSFNRELVLTDILQRIEHYYRQWLQFDVELLKMINRRILGYGEWVSLYVGDEVFDHECKFLGINEEGCLVVLSSDDEIKTFSYEQVHIEIN